MSAGTCWFRTIGVMRPASDTPRAMRTKLDMLRAPTSGAVTAHALVRHSTSRNDADGGRVEGQVAEAGDGVRDGGAGHA